MLSKRHCGTWGQSLTRGGGGVRKFYGGSVGHVEGGETRWLFCLLFV